LILTRCRSTVNARLSLFDFETQRDSLLAIPLFPHPQLGSRVLESLVVDEATKCLVGQFPTSTRIALFQGRIANDDEKRTVSFDTPAGC